MKNSHQFSDSHQQRAGQLALNGPRRAGQAGPRSIEYVFLAITLLTTAFSVILTLIVWANAALSTYGVSFDVMAFPAAGLIIALPVFAGLVIDLARAELKNPGLKLNPYKIYSAQFVQVVAFTTCLFTLIGLVFGVLARADANSGGSSLATLFADVSIILAVAGGILAYYLVTGRKS